MTPERGFVVQATNKHTNRPVWYRPQDRRGQVRVGLRDAKFYVSEAQAHRTADRANRQHGFHDTGWHVVPAVREVEEGFWVVRLAEAAS